MEKKGSPGTRMVFSGQTLRLEETNESTFYKWDEQRRGMNLVVPLKKHDALRLSTSQVQQSVLIYATYTYTSYVGMMIDTICGIHAIPKVQNYIDGNSRADECSTYGSVSEACQIILRML